MIIIPVLLALLADFVALTLDAATVLPPIRVGRRFVERAFVSYALHGVSLPVVVISAYVVSLLVSHCLVPILPIASIPVTGIVPDTLQCGERTKEFVVPVGIFVVIITRQLEIVILLLDAPLKLVPHSSAGFSKTSFPRLPL